MAKVTVLLPLYNEEKEIVEKALKSILEQTFSDFVLMVVLDNPNNVKLEKMIEFYQKQDKRIQFFKNEKNMGLAATLNKMIQKVDTEYIARMDADDISVINRFDIQYKYMLKSPQIDLCGTNIIYIDEEGKFIRNNSNIPEEYDRIKRCLKYKNCMAHPTYFAKTKVMKSIMYRESLKYAQDYDFICRCIEKGFIISNINEYLLYYRISDISDKKLVLQNMTAYYVKKYYRKNILTQKNDLGNLIEKEILKNKESILIKKASIKKILISIKHNFIHLEISKCVKDISYLLHPHKYKIDGIISDWKYKIIMYNK